MDIYICKKQLERIMRVYTLTIRNKNSFYMKKDP